MFAIPVDIQQLLCHNPSHVSSLADSVAHPPASVTIAAVVPNCGVPRAAETVSNRRGACDFPIVQCARCSANRSLTLDLVI